MALISVVPTNEEMPLKFSALSWKLAICIVLKYCFSQLWIKLMAQKLYSVFPVVFTSLGHLDFIQCPCFTGRVIHASICSPLLGIHSVPSMALRTAGIRMKEKWLLPSGSWFSIQRDRNISKSSLKTCFKVIVFRW